MILLKFNLWWKRHFFPKEAAKYFAEAYALTNTFGIALATIDLALGVLEYASKNNSSVPRVVCGKLPNIVVDNVKRCSSKAGNPVSAKQVRKDFEKIQRSMLIFLERLYSEGVLKQPFNSKTPSVDFFEYFLNNKEAVIAFRKLIQIFSLRNSIVIKDAVQKDRRVQTSPDQVLKVSFARIILQTNATFIKPFEKEYLTQLFILKPFWDK